MTSEKGQLIIETLNDEEWKIAERIKSNLQYIQNTLNRKILCGIGVVLVVLIFLLVTSFNDKQPKLSSPSEFLSMLMMSYVLFIAMIGIGVVGAFVSHFVYFRRQIEKRRDDLWLLLADRRTRSVVHKLAVLKEANEEICRMNEVRNLLSPRDSLSPRKIALEFLSAIQS